MTTKKYVFTFVIFALLSVLTLSLFFGGLLIRDQSLLAFYILVALSCVCLVFTIVFIAINYKKLINYDVKRLNEKIDNLDFSIIDTPICQNKIYDNLIKLGYTNEKGIFHKVVEENCGDGGIVNHYYAIVHETDEIIDIPSILKHFRKSWTTYNIGFIFVNNNVEANVEILKKYIKETILDVKAHAYKYKIFFAPIIIANDKIYYIKESGIFMDTYKWSVVEGIRILSDK
ncbi:MAG: hypothetical protein IJX97_05465 [Clostridia bacterium]|nr:hypothetical protein [Clostridia bacterium]